MPSTSSAHSTSMSIPSIFSSPTATASTSSSAPNPRSVALGATIGILAFVLLCGTAIFWTRVRKRQPTDEAERKPVRGLSLRGTAVDSRHIAARITPFGTRDPRQQGQNMRIARLRPDGVWEFHDPLEPINVKDADAMSTTSSVRTKDRMKHGTKTDRSYFAVDGIALPPPAYGTDDGYLKQSQMSFT